MSAENDLIKLYSGQILELAADMPHTDALTQPMATAKKRAPLCGSTVTVELVVTDGVITEFGQDVKACALGQAAASVVGGAIIEQPRSAVEKARAELKAMLTSDGPAPSAPFDMLKVLLPARAYKNRHASILLALDATLDAWDVLDNSASA